MTDPFESTRPTRRDVLAAAAATTAAYWLPASRISAASPSATPFALSSHGSGRATAYAEANKIVTADGKTHVAWLDSPEEGFRVRIRTFDHSQQRWSDTQTVGEGYDNHGGPALTMDSEGYLHIVYYPHHHAMRYRRSTRPGDASQWEPEEAFGERLTYPTLVCGLDDMLYCTARRSYGDRPWEVELWRRPAGGIWQRHARVLRSRHRGYSHFQEALAWGPDGRSLHLSCRFHESSDKEAYGRLQAVAYLVSRDGGTTWQTSGGETVTLPASRDDAEVLVDGGVDRSRILRSGSIVVDAEDRPHLLYSVLAEGRSRLYLASGNGMGDWKTQCLNALLPPSHAKMDLLAPAGLTFTEGGELVIVAQSQPNVDGASNWGAPASEVVAFRRSPNQDAFRFQQISPVDPMVAHWLPNLERETGHNRVPETPNVIYTAGGPGPKNTALVSNTVYHQSVRR